MHEFSKNAFLGQFQWNILPYMMEWRGVSSQISPYFSTWKLSSLTLSHMAKSSICIFRQPRMHKFLKFLPQRVWHLITIIERKEIYGVSRQSKIPYYIQSFCQVWPQGWALSSVQCYLLPYKVEFMGFPRLSRWLLKAMIWVTGMACVVWEDITNHLKLMETIE